VLDAIHANYVVVSFPTRSLGGAGKGMIPHYRGTMSRLVDGKPWQIQELLFPLELVFVVDKGTRAA
jgi:16S rRNA (guanine(1405)-N(7))-methyltransferase